MASFYFLLAHLFSAVAGVFRFLADEARFQGCAITLHKKARRFL